MTPAEQATREAWRYWIRGRLGLYMPPTLHTGEGVLLELRFTDDCINLCGIIVPFELTACGIGTRTLAWLKALADTYALRIVGEVQPCGHKSMNARALRAWYKRNGFTVARSGLITYTGAGLKQSRTPARRALAVPSSTPAAKDSHL